MLSPLTAILLILFTIVPSALAFGDTASQTTLDNPTALSNLAVPTKSSRQIMRIKGNKVGLIVGCTIAGIFFMVVLSVIVAAHIRQLRRRAIPRTGEDGDQVVAVKPVNPEPPRTEGDGHFDSTLAV